ncbi:MAG: hypothetical protein ACRDY1_04125 [Acidimicrobiales bacterium]
MTSVPVVDVLLVVLEFVGLFVATWVLWFAVVAVYQRVSRRQDAATAETVRRV